MAIVLYIEGDQYEKNGIKFDRVKTDLHCMKTYLDLGYKKSINELYQNETDIPTTFIDSVGISSEVSNERTEKVSEKPFKKTGKKSLSKKKEQNDEQSEIKVDEPLETKNEVPTENKKPWG